MSTARRFACLFVIQFRLKQFVEHSIYIFGLIIPPGKSRRIHFLFSEAFSFIFCSNWTLKRFTVKYWFGIRRRPENAESQIISWVTVTTRFTMLQLLRLQLRPILLCRKDKNKHQKHVLISLMNLTIGNYILTLTSRVEGRQRCYRMKERTEGY